MTDVPYLPPAPGREVVRWLTNNAPSGYDPQWHATVLYLADVPEPASGKRFFMSAAQHAASRTWLANSTVEVLLARDWWGLYDTVDHCWLGDLHGPRLYGEDEIAQVAAQLTERQMRWDLGRVRAKVYDGTATQFKDELTFTMSREQALTKLEDGL